MIDVSGLRIPLARLDGTLEAELNACRAATARKLHVRPSQITGIELRKRSVDARKRNAIVILFTARVSIKGDEASIAQRAGNGVRLVADKPYGLPTRINVPLAPTRAGARAANRPSAQNVERPCARALERPVVVGAGCAGLFCALSLASAGLAPLLVERGDDAERRTAAVNAFNASSVLDPESNIQFGLGGAGTFSDGKLGTGTKSPAHRLILETLVEAGAQQRILWDAKSHVGSDVLPSVVTRIVERIRELGGEVRFRTRLVGLDLREGRVAGIRLETNGREERVAAHDVVLACGHSARDVFELLRNTGVTLERKTFAMGVCIEHLQADVDRALYGSSAGHPALGAGSYKLAEHLPGGRSAFSFCMCPGGYVVAAASETGGVVTNGMSLAARAGTNANSGLLANVFPEDLPGDDVLAGIDLQRACERKAFEAGGGSFVAPAQLVGDLLSNMPSSAGGRIAPTYPRGVAWGFVDKCLPDYIVHTLRAAIPRMEHKLRGFSAADAVLTGVETRSSSPVRVTRGDDLQSVSTPGLWPCGEGAGYAGGIMSAATDGLRVAEALVTTYA